jgi:polar amino acid transport system substrate-binding protein
LKSGKNVFVEKPLVLNADELNEVIGAYSEAMGTKTKERSSRKTSDESESGPILMVGFNRRFAPHALQLKRFLADRQGPLMMHYRVNSGYLPRTHWTQDPKEGGGRIIGEVCHFVDFLQFLTGAAPTKIYAEPIAPGLTSLPDDDSVAVTLKFADGSVGVISYGANGDPSMPKERVEVMSTGRSAVLDNFRVLTLFQQGKQRVFKLSAMDKGHRAEIASFLDAVRDGRSSPIPFESLIVTSRVTFRILESLRLGVSISLDQESA